MSDTKSEQSPQSASRRDDEKEKAFNTFAIFLLLTVVVVLAAGGWAIWMRWNDRVNSPNWEKPAQK